MRFIILTIILFGLYSCNNLSTKSLEESIAQTYLQLYPMLVTDLTKNQMIKKLNSQKNVFSHVYDTQSPDYSIISSHNFDVLNSFAWLDFSKGPVTIQFPTTKKFHFVLPIYDPSGNIVYRLDSFSIKNQKSITLQNTTGAPYLWTILRILKSNNHTLKEMKEFQEQFLIPGKENIKSSPTMSHLLQNMNPKLSPIEAIEKLSYVDFFSYGSEILQSFHQNDWAKKMQTKIHRILKDAKINNYKNAMQIANRLVVTLASKRLSTKNNWNTFFNIQVSDKDHFAMKALLSKVGFGLLPSDTAQYYTLKKDNKDHPILGDTSYQLIFKKKDLPVTDGSWSISVYNENGLPIVNDYHRYSLNSKNDLFFQKDESIIFYFSYKKPESSSKIKNWIPLSKNNKQKHSIVFRVYFPQKRETAEKWFPPILSKNSQEPSNSQR